MPFSCLLERAAGVRVVLRAHANVLRLAVGQQLALYPSCACAVKIEAERFMLWLLMMPFAFDCLRTMV